MLLAVLEKKVGFKLSQKDVFINIAGGLKVNDTSTDLAIMSAVLSSNFDIPVPPHTAIAGEVGLSGEIRAVARIEQRIAEAEKLKFRFTSINNSRGMKYVLMNLPKDRLDEAVALIPGMRSPTVLSLADPGWCSLHVVIREDELWEKIEQLKALGAEGILVLALENMIR